ncbi:MAG: hypothetical protein ABIQ27_03860 [Flavobacterium sp.]|uniref:hypothetical protein n=1 Tax=Flavobacterium sp. TaxID=239 RepID=UPI00326520AD
MKILDIFKPKRIVKTVTVYISNKHSEIIIAPISTEKNRPGYYFEQETCEVIDLKSSPEIIGEAIKRNFNKFRIAKNNNSGKVTDWPGLKTSKEKTKVGFEKNYTRISVTGCNEYNISFEIETILNYQSEIDLITTISAYGDNSKLGTRILKIYNSDICERKF